MTLDAAAGTGYGAANPIQVDYWQRRRVAKREAAEALRKEADDAIAEARPFRVNAFILGRGVHKTVNAPCNEFRELYGVTPRAYHMGKLVERIRELQAAAKITRSWIVVRTGASEVLVDKALAIIEAQLTVESAA